MRIAILANPRSGRGKALMLAEQLGAILQSRGHTVHRQDTGPDLDLSVLVGVTGMHEPGVPAGPGSGGVGGVAGDRADRLVIVGGDGTVHHAAQAVAESGVPLYHLATGTENLFARSFRMPKDPAAAADRLERNHPPTEIDLGSANGVPFTLMCSVGVDASVIHRVETVREKPGRRGGHLAYILPGLTEGLRPRPAKVHITADGEPVTPPAGFVGTAIVSNLPAYALRMDPACDAVPNDGRLDLALLPYGTSVGTAWGLLRCKLRSKGIRRIRAASFEIRSADPTAMNPVQIDGERPRRRLNSEAGGTGLPLTLGDEGEGSLIRISLWERRLRVHAPSWE
ncbi:diacylglycerol/lipid kinase family protein [Nodularia spumigena]|uniref:diacylglycerol/lipid kinase family protein n=1 Tax=Nodularia spumigena TaxID=70799 RepID=UPI002B207103|nr:diacylglycerol kinase family protein [Nodularia spumigena]MEA5615399.1 diacylglycerol kinase family protein [Nodularia spumigena UHCC 0040]